METNITSAPEKLSALLAPERSGPAGRFWHLPGVTIARFTLRSYLRSGWL